MNEDEQGTVAAALSKEQQRRVRAEVEAGQTARQIELARAQQAGFVGHCPRRRAWQRPWRRLRHAFRR
jgi:hypothetical protein